MISMLGFERGYRSLEGLDISVGVDILHISFVELVTVMRTNALYLLNAPAWTPKIK